MTDRPIKFRCWDPTNKKFTYWAWDTPGDNFNLAFCLDPQIGVSVTQFTGLTDKNGKDVYAGDIVLCDCGGLKEPCPHEILWVEGSMPRWHMGGTVEGIMGDYAWTGREEVTGNIYENTKI